MATRGNVLVRLIALLLSVDLALAVSECSTPFTETCIDARILSSGDHTHRIKVVCSTENPAATKHSFKIKSSSCTELSVGHHYNIDLQENDNYLNASVLEESKTFELLPTSHAGTRTVYFQCCVQVWIGEGESRHQCKSTF